MRGRVPVVSHSVLGSAAPKGRRVERGPGPAHEDGVAHGHEVAGRRDFGPAGALGRPPDVVGAVLGLGRERPWGLVALGFGLVRQLCFMVCVEALRAGLVGGFGLTGACIDGAQQDGVESVHSTWCEGTAAGL